MTTQNTMPVYVRLILSLLDNHNFFLFKEFCLEYNKDNHINWELEAEWEYDYKDTFKQYLFNKFPYFSHEMIQFYSEQQISFTLNQIQNAQVLLEKDQRQLLIKVLIQQKSLNKDLTVFALNNFTLNEIIQCENTGIDFYTYDLYPYLHVNGDKQKFDYFIEKKKIDYHFSFFKEFFNLYQRHKDYGSKNYYKKENIFDYPLQIIIDKIIHYNLFKNDCSKISYFLSFDELEQFIYETEHLHFSLIDDNFTRHVARHNLYNPAIISKQNLAKLINDFNSHPIEPFFQEAIRNQPFEIAFDYIEYLTTQPNDTYSFYFMYKNQRIRIIKDFTQDQKDKVLKQIMNNFIPKDEEKRNINLNTESMQKFIINMIKSPYFNQSDFSEQILSMINKYKLKDNNYDDTHLIYELYQLYCSRFSTLNHTEQNIIQNLVCTRRIGDSVQVIENIIQKNKNQPNNINKEISFVKNFCKISLPAIYHHLFGENNQTLSLISAPECKTLFENFIILSDTTIINNEDNVTVKKRL